MYSGAGRGGRWWIMRLADTASAAQQHFSARNDVMATVFLRRHTKHLTQSVHVYSICLKNSRAKFHRDPKRKKNNNDKTKTDTESVSGPENITDRHSRRIIFSQMLNILYKQYDSILLYINLANFHLLNN